LPKCEYCEREFGTDAALAQHRRDKHGENQTPAKGGPIDAPKAVKKQKSLRRRNRHTVAIALIAVAVAAGLGAYFVAVPAFASPPFPGITGESWIHVHPYLTVEIDGTNVTIPAGVGILEGASVFEPIHTHDASGLLHVELSQADSNSHNYTLGDYFTIWKYTAKSLGAGESPTLNGRALPVEFSSTDILGFHTNSTYRVVLLVDGKPSSEWSSLNIEQLDYCGSSMSGSPCCPTDCSGPAGPASDPLWDGTTGYPFGTGHTIIIQYVKG